MSSDDRVFERRIVSKRRTSANLEDTPEKQCPNGWAGVVAAAAAAASSSSSSLRQKAAACKISQRTTFQPHPDSICDWFFKVSENALCRLNNIAYHVLHKIYKFLDEYWYAQLSAHIIIPAYVAVILKIVEIILKTQVHCQLFLVLWL